MQTGELHGSPFFLCASLTLTCHGTITCQPYNDGVNSDPYDVTQTTPALLRWGLGLFGCVLVMAVVPDFLRSLWPLSPISPFFILLTGIGLAAGLGLIYACLYGPDERWQIGHGVLTLTRSLRGQSFEREYRETDIDSLTIKTIEWDSGADTYKLVLILRDGKRLNSPQFRTREVAEAARDRPLAKS
jgi:hypothetical protein